MRSRESPKARPMAFPQEFFSTHAKDLRRSPCARAGDVMRWPSLLAGVALVVLAFAAASHVADTREGLIAEVVTLFSGLAGIALLLYGLTARRAPSASSPGAAGRTDDWSRTRTANDLVMGGGGIVLAVALVAGLAISGGAVWAGFGAVMLSPMVIGCVYLCVRFARAPSREWRITLRRKSR